MANKPAYGERIIALEKDMEYVKGSIALLPQMNKEMNEQTTLLRQGAMERKALVSDIDTMKSDVAVMRDLRKFGRWILVLVIMFGSVMSWVAGAGKWLFATLMTGKS
jgi:hypothetical protein